jgi:hypothetical protein
MGVIKFNFIFLLIIILGVHAHGGEVGLGVVVPTIGYKFSLMTENNMFDYSESYSSMAFASQGPSPDRVVNRTLFFYFFIGKSSDSWSPLIGLGGIYMSYVKEYDIGDVEGRLYALGAAFGTYHHIVENLRFYWEINLGIPIGSHTTTENPIVEIKLIPFVPKIGLLYTINF